MNPKNSKGNTSWDLVIGRHEGLFRINFYEVWKYRDLVSLLIKRDFVAQYKQTVMGPLWHILQPLAQTLLYSLFFAGILNVSTDHKPKLLFYLSGIVLWNFFSVSTTSTANTFVANAGIFGKVYFPRLVIPLASVASGFFRFLIQFGIFLVFFSYYLFSGSNEINPGFGILLLPLYLVIVGMIGLGGGLIVSSLSTRYRDIAVLLPLVIQILIYFTPVMLPISIWGDLSWIPRWNPLSPPVEGFRNAFLGGVIDWTRLAYSAAFAIIVFFTGTVLFKRTEKKFMDTV